MVRWHIDSRGKGIIACERELWFGISCFIREIPNQRVCSLGGQSIGTLHVYLHLTRWQTHWKTTETLCSLVVLHIQLKSWFQLKPWLVDWLFQLFEWHACKLACVAKCMSTINKHLTFDILSVEKRPEACEQDFWFGILRFMWETPNQRVCLLDDHQLDPMYLHLTHWRAHWKTMESICSVLFQVVDETHLTEVMVCRLKKDQKPASRISGLEFNTSGRIWIVSKQDFNFPNITAWILLHCTAKHEYLSCHCGWKRHLAQPSCGTITTVQLQLQVVDDTFNQIKSSLKKGGYSLRAGIRIWNFSRPINMMWTVHVYYLAPEINRRFGLEFHFQCMKPESARSELHDLCAKLQPCRVCSAETST